GVEVPVVLHQLVGGQALRFGLGGGRAGPGELRDPLVAGRVQADVHGRGERCRVPPTAVRRQVPPPCTGGRASPRRAGGGGSPGAPPGGTAHARRSRTPCPRRRTPASTGCRAPLRPAAPPLPGVP